MARKRYSDEDLLIYWAFLFDLKRCTGWAGDEADDARNTGGALKEHCKNG